MNNTKKICQLYTNASAEICFFIHIPKCAGTSIIRSISDTLPKDIFVAMNHGTKPYMSVDKYISLFKSIPLKAFEKKIICGHMLFGTHRQTEKLYAYATMLRHPVNRLWSQYCYMQRLGVQRILCRGCDTLVNSEMSFESFVSLSELLPLGNFGCIPNVQTLMIAGEISSNMLDKAKQNIKKYFAVIGVQEQFECFRMALSQYLNIPILSQWLNKKNDKLSSNILSANVIRKIKQRDALDMELYDYVRRML